mmetsp:Transcript_33890/g.49430  ORF Transcript_33890/g.49430 Transcript_33890/m.49430 type:complete len:81 (+) Transcript_33890:1623-1865(+)
MDTYRPFHQFIVLYYEFDGNEGFGFCNGLKKSWVRPKAPIDVAYVMLLFLNAHFLSHTQLDHKEGKGKDYLIKHYYRSNK